MTQLIWADTSEHNPPVDNRYLPKWLAYRVCDGTYVDKKFLMNDHWARNSKLTGYTNYLVWPPSESNATYTETLAVFKKEMTPAYRRRGTVMIDVEMWNRPEYRRDFSWSIEAMRKDLVNWLFSLRPKWQKTVGVRSWYKAMDNRRVWGYGNLGDLRTMAPGVKFANVIVANYTTQPVSYPNMLGRQFTSTGNMAPFGSPVDLNNTKYSLSAFARRAGLGVLRWSLK